MALISPHRRPHYPPTERMAILELRAARGWSRAQTADAFLVERTAGCGSSPLVEYGGTGAYFLDKMAPGQRRLTVYPDAVWGDDPFAPTSLEREVSRVLWTRLAISVRLPDLGKRFQVQRLTPKAAAQADDGDFLVEPGVYVLVREGLPIPKDVAGAFWAPRPKYGEPAVWWQAPSRWREGVALPVRVNVAAENVKQVRLRFDGGGSLTISEVSPYVYEVDVPRDQVHAGTLTARLEVRTADGTNWFSHGAGAEADHVSLIEGTKHDRVINVVMAFQHLPAGAEQAHRADSTG